MELTVIGHSCIDVIHAAEPDTKPIEQLGGILNSVLALAAIASPNDKIYPIFGVGSADYERVLEQLRNFPQVDVSGIFKFRGSTNRVMYFPDGPNGSYVECTKQMAQPIPFSRIKSYLDCDGVLINMISGSDITLETRDYIRMETRDKEIPIHFDFHSLTLGIDKDAKRFRRPLTDWRRWCFMMNSLQLNEEEALGLSAEKFDERMLINQLMPLMVGALLITRHAAGATLVRQEIKKLFRHDIPPIQTPSIVERKGAGDVFGAAFFYHYAKTGNALAAAEFANVAGAAKTQLKGTEEISRLNEVIKQLQADAPSKTPGEAV